MFCKLGVHCKSIMTVAFSYDNHKKDRREIFCKSGSTYLSVSPSTSVLKQWWSQQTGLEFSSCPCSSMYVHCVSDVPAYDSWSSADSAVSSMHSPTLEVITRLHCSLHTLQLLIRTLEFVLKWWSVGCLPFLTLVEIWWCFQHSVGYVASLAVWKIKWTTLSGKYVMSFLWRLSYSQC